MKTILTFILLATALTHAADIPFTLDKPGKVSAATNTINTTITRIIASALAWWTRMEKP